ncbi:sigma-70 family RNA polymerase sigma factor [Bacillus sp. ISL-35]|uniref:sigma-70 family RNA polymerase sigma factor n=1 Tax=Bacillus sp. ISL-35 TaxID=2819122 RepID=UPI001BEC449A|nr:sigma-70 family RNA polymerase sigma factor [Bacillus sp. ISL-35]MBT2680275.1 sigma-70 family RNA polymerase sigma factor [Bacillus sp. ISL-35]MBT2702866.1 sigma-70 family RNA polymerase sigma factor [Chryseobacterium sp. ISL-80]
MKEERLVKKAVKGNARAFEELLILHSERLYRTAFLYAGNREDALDIVQETSCKAFLAIGQLKNEQYFLTWLTRILIHCAYDVLKKREKEMPVNELVELPSSGDNRVAENLDLMEAITLLKEQHRTAIILFYYHDLSISEIARSMDIPENTVKTYLQRGRKELKNRLGGEANGKENVS